MKQEKKKQQNYTEIVARHVIDKSKLPNRDYAPEKLSLNRYGNIDKTITQSKSMETLIRFILEGLSVIKSIKIPTEKSKKWINDAYIILRYWDDCTKISQLRKKISYKNRHGGNNARDN